MFRIVIGGLLAALLAGAAAFAQTPTGDEILQRSDAARGGGLPGVRWRVAVLARDGEDSQRQTLIVSAQDDSSLVEFIDPPKVRGQKLLMVSRNMWFIRPGLRKPVPISPRQRLLGQASNSDVASTNYSGDYQAERVAEESEAGEPCHVLELTAANRNVTYDRIRYWVSQERMVGVKAEFYTVSGRVFKTARFEYQNRIDYQGESYPFISRMVITDAVDPSQVTELDYSEIEAVALPASTFNLQFLVR